MYDTDDDRVLCAEESACSTSAMEFGNIATHELGHSVGMGDLYTDACSMQTLCGYAGSGETNKHSLEDGVIAGVRALYR